MNYESRWLARNYREREKILLAMPHDPAKSGEHEVCSHVRNRVHRVCIANICGFATALPGEAGATVWRRSNCDRGRFDSIFCWRSSHYSAEIELCLVAGRGSPCNLRVIECATYKAALRR